MSRLLSNSDQYRNVLNARKLYTNENPYDANENERANAINSVVNTLKPFSSFDIENTVLGNALNRNRTPLAQIALQMLATQLSYSAGSNAAAEYLPDINFNNLFDGNPRTKLITTKVDFQITRRETQSSIGKILEEVSGTYPNRGNPFTPVSTNADYVRNTGRGQLQILLDNLGRNTYKPSSTAFESAIEAEGFDYDSGISNKRFFIGNDSTFAPYDTYKSPSNFDSFIETLNTKLSNEIIAYKDSTANKSLEYGANQDFINKLGKTKKFDNNNFGNGEYFINSSDFGLDDNPNNQLVWGRDYVENEYVQSSDSFDDPTEGVVPTDSGRLGVKTDLFTTGAQDGFIEEGNAGLLSYTRSLLNSKGKYANFDMTRKKFVDQNEQLHFNGSPLGRRVTGEIDRNRQHSILDPYNRFVKAIRYNGNKIYGGNEDSVIYNSVIPKITPTQGDGFYSNGDLKYRRVMFSIENLAHRVSRPDGSGFVVSQDSNGVLLPECEAGQYGGRVMWFPPYDIRLSENIIVNRETTNFIGRGEPIYTYINTERIANLQFKLIIDYPPQVRNSNINNHEDASRFFAFGGTDEIGSNIVDVGALVARKKELEIQRDEIIPKERAIPDIPNQTLSFHFANDEPSIGGESLSVQEHIDGNYEIDSSQPTTFGDDGRNTGLNVEFVNRIDILIGDYFIDEEKAKHTKIVLLGSASDLFLGAGADEYNKLLSGRRIQAMINYIKGRYSEIVGRSLESDNIEIQTIPIGGQGADATDDPEEIPTDPAKRARRVDVTFTKNDFTENTEPELTPDQIEEKEGLDSEIASLDAEIKLLKNQNARVNRNVGSDFKAYTIEDGVLKGFDPIINKKYKPAFHSQTPEDFHRRLTFLQQCCRQGEGIKKLREDGSTLSSTNSVFGRQPVQVLRIGDFFHTKVVIDNMNIDYTDAPWDMNPEGMGMQFMIADVKLTLKVIGGQSLKAAINELQNAISYNYYANSTFYGEGVYAVAREAEKRSYISPEDNDIINEDKNRPDNDTQAITNNNP